MENSAHWEWIIGETTITYDHGSKICHLSPATTATATDLRSMAVLFHGIADLMEDAELNSLASAKEIVKRLDAAVMDGVLTKIGEKSYRMTKDEDAL